MIKKYNVEVDCANCAAKMEDACRKISGIHSISIYFMAQKMTVDFADRSKKPAKRWSVVLNFTAEERQHE